MDVNTFLLYGPYTGEKSSPTNLEEEESLTYAATKISWIEHIARKETF